MNKNRLRNITVTGLAAALLCVTSPISIPVGDVPLSLATLVILIAAGVLGSVRTTTAVAVYLILGCVGLPVFSGFAGGFGRFLGPTGGFLIGYIPLALIAGVCKDKASLAGKVSPMIIGTAVLYNVGSVWYTVYADVPVWTAFAVCVVPYLPLDLLKIAAAAAVVGKIGRTRDGFALMTNKRKANKIK